MRDAKIVEKKRTGYSVKSSETWLISFCQNDAEAILLRAAKLHHPLLYFIYLFLNVGLLLVCLADNFFGFC